jgi:signal peptidase I
LYEPYSVPSTSMLPTLPRKSHILVEKRPSVLRRGEIVTFRAPRDPGAIFVQRLLGLPGDRITYSAKHVLVNGMETRVRQLDDFLDDDNLKYKQRYANRIDGVEFDTLIDADMPAEMPEAWHFPMSEACVRSNGAVECTVPADHYFMMGDNRDNSNDSRYFGFVRVELVTGRVAKVF